jgi:hypothetical protein
MNATKNKGGCLEMDKLTRIPPMRSESTIAAGIELGFADSGETLQKGTTDCRRLELPLFDSLSRDDIDNEAHLLGHSKDSGTACSDGSEDRRS